MADEDAESEEDEVGEVAFDPNRERIVGLLHRLGVLTPTDMRELAARHKRIEGAKAQAVVSEALEIAQSQRPQAWAEVQTYVPATIRGTMDGDVTRLLHNHLWTKGSGALEHGLLASEWEALGQLALSGRSELEASSYEAVLEGAVEASLDAALGLLIEDTLTRAVYDLLVFSAQEVVPWLSAPKPQIATPEALTNAISSLSGLSGEALQVVAEMQATVQEMGFRPLTKTMELTLSLILGNGRNDHWRAATEAGQGAAEEAVERARIEGTDIRALGAEMVGGAVDNTILALTAHDLISAQDWRQLTWPLATVLPSLRR